MVTDRLAAILLVGILAAPVHAQSRASLFTEPGSSVYVMVDLQMSTDYGPVYGSDTDGAAAAGTALMTVFPTDPQFTHAILHSIHLDFGAGAGLEYSYSFFFGQVELTLTDLVFHSTGPAFGTINAGGDASFLQASQHMTGWAHVFSSALGIDHTMEFDDSDVAPLGAHIAGGAGTALLTGLSFRSFHYEADPGELPPGLYSLVIDVTVDATDVGFSGPYTPALLGDWDADGDFDLSDLAGLHDCLAGPDVSVDVFCTLFDFDDDADVDMTDVAAFAENFTGPL